MLAKDSIDGQVYQLPARGKRPAYQKAVSSGWNSTHEWLLFLVADELGKRKMTMVSGIEEIQPIE